MDIYFYKAQMLFKYSDDELKAISIFKFIKSHKPNDIEVRTILGKYYFDHERWYRAKDQFLGILKINPLDTEAMDYLSKIASRFQRKLNMWPFNLRLRKELMQIFEVLGYIENKDYLKLTFRKVLKGFIVFMKIPFIIFAAIVGVIIVIAGVGLVISTKGVVIPLFFLLKFVYRLVYQIYSKRKKKTIQY